MSVEYAHDAPNVLITGANKGIGLALAKDFQSKGYNVIGTSRKMEELVIKELKKVACHIVHLELKDPESLQSLPGRLSGFDKIDILINNAGIFRRDNLDTLDKETLMHIYEVNTVGALLVTQALQGKLRDKVVQISSRLGSIGENSTGKNFGYRLSKAAMNMMTKTLALDLPHLVCVSVHPGLVETEALERISSSEMSPEECAPLLTDLILRFEKKHTGGFYNRSGAEIRW